MKTNEKMKTEGRRDFLKNVTLSTAGLMMAGTGITLNSCSTGKVKSSQGDKKLLTEFPKEFWWGSASASYQVEGAAAIDGRAPSIWDTFSHTPGRVKGGDTGDISCDLYHRFEEDIKLMVDLGIQHYRFSLSWSRIIPSGRGAVNQKGLDYYKRFVDTLLKNGITPHATLYHWDLPQGLQDLYKGWESREIVKDFGDYASVVAKELGDRIEYWMTLNEISSFTHIGYGVGKPGTHAPGLQLNSRKDQNQIIHNTLMAHGTACQALRAHSTGKTNISIANDHKCFVPTIETTANIEASLKAFKNDDCNGGIIMPILTGAYDEVWLKKMGDQAPDFTPEEMKLIAQPLDSLAFNNYTGSYVQAAENELGYEVIGCGSNYPKGNMPWLNIVPEAIYWGIRHVSEIMENKLPIFISENGLADGTEPDAQGFVKDIDRIMYYRGYLRQVLRAINEGYPAIGYLPWSFSDNFEWAEGYAKRFGMVRVDYQTQKRIPKLSYYWFQEVIKQNSIV